MFIFSFPLSSDLCCFSYSLILLLFTHWHAYITNEFPPLCAVFNDLSPFICYTTTFYCILEPQLVVGGLQIECLDLIPHIKSRALTGLSFDMRVTWPNHLSLLLTSFNSISVTLAFWRTSSLLTYSDSIWYSWWISCVAEWCVVCVKLFGVGITSTPRHHIIGVASGTDCRP